MTNTEHDETDPRETSEDAAAQAQAEATGNAPVAEVPLEEQLAARDAEIADLKERVVRQLAETENVRRRLDKEKQDAGAYAMTNFARELLAVADNLRRALSVVPDAARSDPSLSGFLVGVEMTEKELLTAFGKFGIVKVEAQGERLNPNLHQAMVEIPTAEAEPGTVVQVMQDGYQIKERLLRPALVGVAKAPDGGGETAPPPSGSTIDTTA